MTKDSIKFNSIEDLDRLLDSLPTKEKKVSAIMDYFLENVEYDYATLELASLDYKIVDYIDTHFSCDNPLDIIRATHYLKHDASLSDEAVDRLLQFYGKKQLVPATPERKMFGKIYPATFKHYVTNNLLMSLNQVPSPVTYENGLIKKGVCAHFSEFIKSVCNNHGIECSILGGSTPVAHAWNRVSSLHYDITYAMFVRDHYNDWDKKTTSSHWLGVSDKALLTTHPTRTISSEDSRPIVPPITHMSFDKD